MQSCHNWCERWRVVRNPRGGSLADQGCAYCSTCIEYIPLKLLLKPHNLCPCCKTKVRKESRNAKPKEPNYARLFDWLFQRRDDIPRRVEQWRQGRLDSELPFYR